jgi:hypothetical protein
VSVAMDMTEGIIARVRTMAIFRPSVLTGHVLGSVIQTMIGLAAVIGVALLIGFDPTATPVEWLATAGTLVMITFAVTWFSVACGLVAKSVEAASNLPMPLTQPSAVGASAGRAVTGRDGGGYREGRTVVSGNMRALDLGSTHARGAVMDDMRRDDGARAACRTRVDRGDGPRA